MDSHQDRVFFNTFLAVLGVLFAITFIIVLVANLVTPGDEAHPEYVARVEERIRPVGNVVTDPDALVKTAAPAAREPRSGQQVYSQVCTGCHAAGVLGAAKTGDAAAWSQLQADRGEDGLVEAVIAGKGAMPPRGGDPSLSDEEIKAAVRYLLDEAGV